MPFQRKLGTLIFLLILSVCVTTPAFAFLNQPDGFRGIKWVTNISELPDMSLVKDDGDTKYYLRKNDKMKIGEADIGIIIYAFYKNRFYATVISFNGHLNFKKLKDTFFAQYGQPDRPNEVMKTYFWDGGIVTIKFGYNEASEKGDIYYFWNSIHLEREKDNEEKAKEIEKDNKEKAKQGAKDL